MTDKSKKRTRAHMLKTGMTYQASRNALASEKPLPASEETQKQKHQSLDSGNQAKASVELPSSNTYKVNEDVGISDAALHLKKMDDLINPPWLKQMQQLQKTLDPMRDQRRLQEQMSLKPFQDVVTLKTLQEKVNPSWKKDLAPNFIDKLGLSKLQDLSVAISKSSVLEHISGMKLGFIEDLQKTMTPTDLETEKGVKHWVKGLKELADAIGPADKFEAKLKAVLNPTPMLWHDHRG